MGLGAKIMKYRLTDIYQTVTDTIVAAIEDGRANGDDWTMPWANNPSGMPVNAVTKHPYRGVNVVMLSMFARANGYRTNGWATYKQWQSKGANVAKGEHGTMVVFFKSQHLTRENADGERETVTIPLLRYTTAFNAAQVEGYEAPVIERPCLAHRIDEAEAFVAATGADVRYGEGRAYYRRADDFIGMPAWDDFLDSKNATATENAYGTLLHELTHWTGTEGRCERNFGKRFGDHAYAAEELVAELGAAFMCSRLNITPQPRLDHAQYIEHWLRMLKSDKKAIFTAAARASDATEYLSAFSDLFALVRLGRAVTLDKAA
jgi:antirestriction protein ArdC